MPGGSDQLVFSAQSADSDEVAWAFRDDVARDYEMISPGCGAPLAWVFLAWAGWQSSVPEAVLGHSVPSVAARRLDGDEIVEIEVDNRLQRLAGSAVVQRFGEVVEPGGIFGL